MNVRGINIIVLILIMFTGAGCHNHNEIIYTGSNSVKKPIEALAKAYMQKNPQVKVKVMGSGSDSFHLSNEVIYGQSREIKPEEEKWIKKYGPVQREVFCYGAIAIFVNPENPVKSLDMEQLKKIYNGEIKNWKEVGGEDNPIAVVSRGGRSGSEKFFEDKVLKGDKITGRRYAIGLNDGIVKVVSKHKFAIGFAEVGYVDNSVKTIALAERPGTPGILPELKNLQDRTYPLTRPLYLFIKNDAKPEVKDFMNFILSSEGQTVLKNIQYAPGKN